MSRLAAVVVVFILIAAGCGGTDGGDLQAFCDLVTEGSGVGTDGGSLDTASLQKLHDVAPPDIRSTVQELVNASRDLGEITELDQLFSAAFDPDAQQARVAFIDYSAQSCNLDLAALDAGQVDSATAQVDAIRTYVNDNFAGEQWVSRVNYEVQRVDGELDGITVNFVVGATGDDAIQACNAVSVYLYEIRGGEGQVQVLDKDLVIARRDGPDAVCLVL